MASSSPIVGIDFGTTNSSIAYTSHDQTKLVEFPSNAGISHSSRSLIYLQRRLQLEGKPVKSWTGAAAIENYLAADSADETVQRRLIQSLKSHLSDRSLTGTEIFGRRWLFEDLLARILSDLRQVASATLGFEVTQAVAGRPVMFVGAQTENDNAFAVDRLRSAFVQAGFQSVEFIMEPVAAAFAYAPESHRNEILLVGDFGGGTTDFSLLQFQGSGAQPQVLGTTGVGLAGDALDARIVRHLVSPALGSEALSNSLGKLLPTLPAWIYANLERWHTLSFLRTNDVREMIRTALKRTLEPAKIETLQAVIEHDLGYRLHQAVQRTKTALSSQEHAAFDFDSDVLRLQAEVTRAQFEEWIAPEVRKIERSLDMLFRSAEREPQQVDRVFLTGGTCLVPAIRRVFTDRFSEDRVRSVDVFTSVASGLSRIAASREWQEHHSLRERLKPA